MKTNAPKNLFFLLSGVHQFYRPFSVVWRLPVFHLFRVVLLFFTTRMVARILWENDDGLLWYSLIEVKFKKK